MTGIGSGQKVFQLAFEKIPIRMLLSGSDTAVAQLLPTGLNT